jgi:hypothetical protein
MLIFMHVNKSAGDRGIQHVLCRCCSTTGLQRVDVPIDYMSIKIKIRTCLNLIMPQIIMNSLYDLFYKWTHFSSIDIGEPSERPSRKLHSKQNLNWCCCIVIFLYKRTITNGNFGVLLRIYLHLRHLSTWFCSKKTTVLR